MLHLGDACNEYGESFWYIPRYDAATDHARMQVLDSYRTKLGGDF